MPTFVDDEGFAGFISEPIRDSREREECDAVRADPFLTPEGKVDVVGCMDFVNDVPRKAGVGAIAQSDCVAAFVDFEWDTSFDCT
jgi:hypothetical protein